jgi:hypothetical protein
MLPSIGRIVQYTNLGDKDGKYPPEVQAALVTGVYRGNSPTEPSPGPGNNDHLITAGIVIPANTLGATVDSTLVDLKVFYRTGFFDMRAVPFSEAPARGHWNWPPRT